jgi:hypothetical protein
MASEPDRDLTLAFPVDKVIATAEKLLHRDRFDADLLLSEVDSDSESDSSTEETSDNSSDSESSESEEEFFLKSRKAKKATKKVANRKETKGIKPKSPKQAPRKTENTTSLEPLDEMEGLIKKMSSISIEDPDYALLYYRATKIDPEIKNLVAAPVKKRGGNNVYFQSKANSEDRGNTTTGNYSNKEQPGSRFYNPPNTPFQERTCYGCGENGHSTPYCEKINKLVREGRLIETGRRITCPDNWHIIAVL